MIRLHFWTIVLDLCINAKADRPAPAVVRCLRNPRSGKTMFIPSAAHIRCAIGETAWLVRPHDSLDRSKPTSSGLSWLRPHAAGGKADSQIGRASCRERV